MVIYSDIPSFEMFRREEDVSTTMVMEGRCAKLERDPTPCTENLIILRNFQFSSDTTEWWYSLTFNTGGGGRSMPLFLCSPLKSKSNILGKQILSLMYWRPAPKFTILPFVRFVDPKF